MRTTGKTRTTLPAAALLVTVTLALTACSDRDTDNAPSFTEMPDDTASDSTSDSTSDSRSDTAIAQGPTVTAAGKGPVAVTADSTHDGDPTDTTPVSGKLIVGPGACFSLTETGRGSQGAPRPLILPVGSESVTADGRPSVTLPGQDATYVGTDITVAAAEIPVSDIDGFPEQCSHASGTALFVSAD